MNSRPRGFTLTEVAVAAGVILVLAGIAIATFSVLRSGSQSAEAETNLLRVRTAQELHYSHNGQFTTDRSEMAAPPEGISFVTVASSSPSEVSIAHSGADLALAGLGRDDQCYWLKLDASTGQSSTGMFEGASCSGGHVLSLP